MIRWIALSVLLICTSYAQETDLNQLVSWMCGDFSSAQQAVDDSSFFDIRVRMVPIWETRQDGYWIYVEQAAASRMEKPYRQRVYHVYQDSSDTFHSDVYELHHPERYTGETFGTTAFETLVPDSLVTRPGCSVLLRKNDSGFFSGQTVDGACLSDHRGAAWVRSEVEVRADRIITWDRGYDANGNQVWGSANGPYIFRRVSPAESLIENNDEN